MDSLHTMNVGTSIPDSILLHIFGYLPYHDLCRAAQVCQLWRRIALDSSLRIIVDVRATPLPVQLVKKLIRAHCTIALHDLRLRGFMAGFKKPVWKVTTLTPECLNLLEKFSPQLRCLTMEDAFLVKDGKRPNINFSHFPKSVQHLSLHGSLFQTDLKQISSGLVCLNLGYCTFVTSYDLDILKHAPNLRVLYLEGCFRVNDGGVDHLYPILPQLRVLDLEATAISDEGVITLFQNSVAMEELYIGHNAVTDVPLMSIVHGQMPKLSTLCAVKTEMTYDMDKYVFRRLPSLRVLALSSESVQPTCSHYLHHKCPVMREKKSR